MALCKECCSELAGKTGFCCAEVGIPEGGRGCRERYMKPESGVPREGMVAIGQGLVTKCERKRGGFEDNRVRYDEWDAMLVGERRESIRLGWRAD